MYIQSVQPHTQCEETVHLLKDEEGSVEVVAEGGRSEEITLLVIIHTKFNNSLIAVDKIDSFKLASDKAFVTQKYAEKLHTFMDMVSLCKPSGFAFCMFCVVLCYH